MLKIYITRHGETEWNKENRMQGRLDSKLTGKGKRQAALLGERLKATNFSRVISSPSHRALSTAHLIVGESQQSIETDARLMEIALGDWQGKTGDEIQELYPDQHHAYWNDPEGYKNQHGEGFQDVVERAQSFLRDLEGSVSGNVLLVTHGVVVKALYLIFRNASISDIWNPPFIHGTSLTVVENDHGIWKIVKEACLAHCE